MFRENGWYGHRRALGRYAGFESPPPIWGYLQHGWHVGNGFAPYRPANILRPLVWSTRNLEEARAFGLAVAAVGAPFLYLLRQQPPGDPVGHGTIVYPFHSWERGDSVGNHEAYARQIIERESGPVTVCLYWLDYERESIRRKYEEAGAMVICHGAREAPDFLERQVGALLSHRRLVTNRVSTALWYGAAAGLEVEIYGPPMGLGGEAEGRAFDRFQRERWPEFVNGRVRDARSLANQELGAAHMLDQAELCDFLGWRGWRYDVGPVVQSAIRMTQTWRSRWQSTR
jgi:hypothetical protein